LIGIFHHRTYMLSWLSSSTWLLTS
jgi:hypothetical protein